MSDDTDPFEEAMLEELATIPIADMSNEEIGTLEAECLSIGGRRGGRLRAALFELRRHRAMKKRLLEWATQLEANRDKPGDVGKFIAAELRNRMAGAPPEAPRSASDPDAHGGKYLEPFDRGRR